MNLIIEQEAISQNDRIFGTNQGASRHLYKKHRDKTKERIVSVVGKVEQEEDRTAWLFERQWGKGKRVFDQANLIGGFKPLVDSMVKIGLIKDDSPDLFKGYYTQKKSSSGVGFIRIQKLIPIEELEVALGELSESFYVSEERLLQVAEKVNLTRKENDN